MQAGHLSASSLADREYESERGPESFTAWLRRSAEDTAIHHFPSGPIRSRFTSPQTGPDSYAWEIPSSRRAEEFALAVASLIVFDIPKQDGSPRPGLSLHPAAGPHGTLLAAYII